MQELNRGTMQQRIKDDESEAAAHAKTPRRKRFLIAAVCCIVALTALLMAVPGARAAALDWFGAAFSPREYLLTPKEERAPIPEIENAVTVLPTPAAHIPALAPQVPESAHQEEPAAPVIKTTFVKEGWESIIDTLSFTFEEIFYNGEQIFLSGYLEGDLRNFYAKYTEAPAGEDVLVATALFELQGRQAGGSMELPFFNIADSAAIKSAEQGKTRFAFTCDAQGGLEGLTGEQQFDMTLTLSSEFMTHKNHEGTFYDLETICTMAVEGLRFHAAKSAQIDETIPLHIERMIGNTSVEYYKKKPESYGKPSGKSKYHLVTRSLEGGRLVVESIRKRFTSAEFNFTLYLPEDWDAYDWHGLMYQLCFEYIVGDQSMIPPSGMGFDFDKEANAVHMHITGVPILYGDWEKVDDITIQLHYYPPLPGLSRGTTLEGSQVPITGARVTIPSRP